MLGVAGNIQGTAAELQVAGTILPLQIDSDTSLHRPFMFCNMGAAQFWIEPADLAKGSVGCRPACRGGAFVGRHGSRDRYPVQRLKGSCYWHDSALRDAAIALVLACEI